jgi:RimJ/RimL family protein N-acetyltransferase
MNPSSVVQVIYAKEDLIPSYHQCLDLVAKEKIYVEMTEAPPLEKVMGFQKALIAAGGPVFYAVQDNSVVGWCDVFPEENPRLKHRGSLGMGLHPEFRGRGLGKKLLAATLDKAKEFGLEKVELHVYTTNLPAIALYKKLGFSEEGTIKKYRKLDGVYFDCLSMGKFLA